ncbi:MAG: trigger factor [Eubacteriales bacterium]
MGNKVEKIGGNKVKIEFSISPETFEDAISRAFAKNKDKFSVPGFRKGKAPRAIVEKHYGDSVLFEEAFDIAFPEEYAKVVEETKIDPVAHPEIDITSFDKAKGIDIKVEVFVKPEVKLGSYTGVEASKKQVKITEKDVNEELNRLLEKNARWEAVEDEAKLNDRVTIDYSGSVDGVKFEGGTAEKQPLELGSKTFIPGFEEQVVGMKIGEERDIKVTFPKEYHAKELAGKEAVFAVKLHDIKRKELDELDDEFAKDVSEFETLAELKKDIKKRLKAEAEKKAKEETEDEVLRKIVDGCEIDVPSPMIELQIDRQIERLEYNLMYQGIKLEDYLKYTGTKMEDLRAQHEDTAKSAVRSHLVIEAIAKKEDIETTEEDLNKFFKEESKKANKTVEEYKKLIGSDGIENITARLAFEKTLKFIFDSINYVEQKKEEKAEKKAPATSTAKKSASKTGAKTTAKK